MTVRVVQGNCLELLREMPAESVHCVVTSPPYWGLRDYKIPPIIWGGDAACGHEWTDTTIIDQRHAPEETPSFKQATNAGSQQRGIKPSDSCFKCGAWRGTFGLEPALPLYVEHMVQIFREVRRVLRDDGTLWLNLGDSYNAGRNGGHAGGQKQASYPRHDGITRSGANVPGLKPKDLCGIPWRVAFALQDDGWYLRQDIIWHKPNPMPESVVDRCTKAHEFIFLLRKSGRPTVWRHRDTGLWVEVQPAPDYVWQHKGTREERKTEQVGDDWRRINLWRGFDYYFDANAIAEPVTKSTIERMSQPNLENQAGSDRVPVGTRNKRSVWPVDEDEFEQFLRWKAERSGAKSDVWTVVTQPFGEVHFATFPPALIEPCIKAGCPAGGTVLDPFGGSGTTGLVADRLQRHAILLELNADYAEMARRRLTVDAGMFAEVAE